MKSDLDEDFFTPAPGTSLANIFSNKNSDKTQNSENTTLKYVAPKASDFKNIQEDNQGLQNESNQVVDNTSKSSECVFAQAVYAYELVNNTYVPRGKLGLALLKLFTPIDMKLVLYDSNKRALSSASVSARLEVQIQNNKYVSYCDDMKKNWSLSCSNIEEIDIIIQTFREWNINIIYNEYVRKGPSTSPKPVVTKNLLPETLKDSSDKGSDTDSSINRKTKTSILNRMALVGQSVLPSPSTIDKTSDSSDTDLHPQHRISRHKPHKTNSKRQHAEKKVTDEVTISQPAYTMDADYQTSIIKTPIQLAENMHMGTDLKQLVSITSFSNDNLSHSTDMKHFISENRVNNTELRININRVADKLDLILNKIKNSECKGQFCNNSDFTKSVFQKLLIEYESRIRDQDEKIKQLESLLQHKTSVTTKCDIFDNQKTEEINNKDEILNLRLKIESLEKENCDKTNEIGTLKSDIEGVRKSLINRNEVIHELEKKCESVIDNLAKKSEEYELLKVDHHKINEEFCQLKEKFKETIQKPNEQIHAQLKSIMNNTFRSLAANFDNDENYRGDSVKTIVGTIIKKTTMEVLNT
ncbi:FK506-binding protein 15 [Eumeta japonica]|uniref:FK506-binding protein 15 n=1 Tax=Eumeta variegata TaxID=151549 RepID=A0A4C1XS57_EUMVA|nr:FK506-binding protein 15 [Eumeta japonica]